MEYSYGKINRLSNSLIKNKVPKNTYASIMKDGERITKNSKNKEKAQWFFSAITTMDHLLDSKTKKKVREDCACCLSGKRQKLCKQVNKEYSTAEERIRAINDTHYIFGNEIKIIGNGKYEVSFFNEDEPIKKCVCIKDLEGKMSKTYCFCCGGHAKYHLETVLGVPLKVKTVSSALSSEGKQNCTFQLTEI
jgi:hypothetical protein